MSTSAKKVSLIAFVFVVGALSAFVLITRSEAAAVVGQTQTFQIVSAAGKKTDAQDLKSAYRRPQVIPFPKDDPYTPEKAALGKKLYFDTRLSEARLLSCASCHSPAYAWGDGQPKGIGHLMKELGRRSPSIINAAYGQVFMWDGRMASLEEQALGPITGDTEMAMTLEKLLQRLDVVAEYKPLFVAAFPGQDINSANVAKAIATFERTVVSGTAPFDRWVDGDEKAISENAKRGFVLFNTKAQCSGCHSSWRFTDDSFQDIGLRTDDVGRGKFLEDVSKAQYAFKTPGLREIAHRAPYMHDGSISTLDAVVDHYNSGGIERASRSELIKPLGLTADEKADLVAFMQTLTSEATPTTMPVLPR
jgi:cytochrome c peroxidase